MRCFASGFELITVKEKREITDPGRFGLGVYRMYFGSSTSEGAVGPVGFAFLIFPSSNASKAFRVASATLSSSSFEGRSSLVESPKSEFEVESSNDPYQ
jgi:hypothetical protein